VWNKFAAVDRANCIPASCDHINADFMREWGCKTPKTNEIILQQLPCKKTIKKIEQNIVITRNQTLSCS